MDLHPPSPSSNAETIEQSVLGQFPFSAAQAFQTRYSLQVTRAHLHEDYQPGFLHLVPCALDQYLELPNTGQDRYDLVEGILIATDIGDHEHYEIRDGLTELLRSGVRALGREGEVEVCPGRMVDATSSAPEESSSNRTATIRRPDIVVLDPAANQIRESLCPLSQRITAPRGYPPLMAVEVTSTGASRVTDLEEKRREYQRAGVNEYMIVDRDLPHRANPRVIICRLDEPSGGYSWTEYTGDEEVECTFLRRRDSAASKLLDPPKPHDTAGSPARKAEQARRAAEERSRRDREQSRHDREALKKAEERSKRDQEELKKLREQLEKGGEKSKRERGARKSGEESDSTKRKK